MRLNLIAVLVLLAGSAYAYIEPISSPPTATPYMNVGSSGIDSSGSVDITGASSFLTVQSSMTAPWANLGTVIAYNLTATASTTTLSYLSNLGGAAFGGNVGIGTTNPTRPVHIVGAGVNVTGTLYDLARATLGTGDTQGVALGYDSNGGGVISAVTAATGQSLNFWTYNGSAWGERMRISKEGNLGIGTTNPGAALDVGGGMLKLKQMTLAAIVAATPGATEVGGMVMCTNCAANYSICVATGTTVQGFKLFGAATGTECK